MICPVGWTISIVTIVQKSTKKRNENWKTVGSKRQSCFGLEHSIYNVDLTLVKYFNKSALDTKYR